MKTFLALALFLNAGVFANTPIQIFKTSLTITVRDELGNTVEGASIKIFEKKEDFIKEQNVIEEGTSNAKGVFHFRELKATTYFILIRKGDKDNTTGGEQTKLEKGKFNKVTIIIQ